jgi:hypothetical protein
MSIQDIAKSEEKKAIFEMVLEEACRQWCDCIDDVPKRKDGEGFADFFYEIFEDKEDEYIEQIKELNGGRLPSLQPKH